MPTHPSPAVDQRQQQASAWVPAALREAGIEAGPLTCEAVAGDASFRRYFRFRDQQRSWVLMDAPPELENSRPFVDIATRLRAAGLHAPGVLASDLDRGFLLLEDLGDTLLRDVLSEQAPGALMSRLLDLLTEMAARVDASGLPDYDRTLLATELELFPRWYLQRHKGLQLDGEAWDIWEALCSRLIGSALAQPMVFVHRDFHSCNLLLADDRIGIIDFQDAVRGPLTYDFASLVWDRYISWPRAQLEEWMEHFRRRCAPWAGREEWLQWCDWIGLQRNLKIIGIFARLHYRDGKQGYLEMIPRFWGYMDTTLQRYPEFSAFRQQLEHLSCAP